MINIVHANCVDDHVDNEIFKCLNLNEPKSFFLFAGAGSGKTRSLVNVLTRFKRENEKLLKLNGQRVAIITYTNAACDEIRSRLDFNPLFSVSTIHSFIWELVCNYQNDIREWLRKNLNEQIEQLELEQLKGRTGAKASFDREKSIRNKTTRIEYLNEIIKFTYNPNGDNKTKDSLNHAEVIGIGAYFLTEKLLLQKILVNKFPILLIDESQDTNKHLMNAFLKVQNSHSRNFSLGLFGDTMQRIYTDGKLDLGLNLPEDWITPKKVMNHRCSKRVITLINKIRSSVDNQMQQPRTDKAEGFVRLFIVPRTVNKKNAEYRAAEIMATITGDNQWDNNNCNFKSLILEHHMAANRMGFLELFEPLYKVDSLKTGLIDGSLSGLRFFTQLILPLVIAKNNSDLFGIAQIVQKNSPLLSHKDNSDHKDTQLIELNKANNAVNQLFGLWNNNNIPTCIDIVQNIAKTKLFEIPDSLFPIAFRTEEEQNNENLPEEANDSKRFDELTAWDISLKATFDQIISYDNYVNGTAKFGTHQGVKGLQFPRVMVILSDEEARGFLFSYEKLFGAKEKTATDLKNEMENHDSSVDRTRRLFYVTCSRAEKSLAIIAYTETPDKVKRYVLEQNWFVESEIELLE